MDDCQQQRSNSKLIDDDLNEGIKNAAANDIIEKKGYLFLHFNSFTNVKNFISYSHHGRG